MGDNRTAVLTSIALFAACSGKLATNSDHGGDPAVGAGTSGTTTGMQATTGMDTTTGMTDPDPGFGGSSSTGLGGSPGTTSCGSVQCGPGSVCCNASCGVCVQPGEGCPAIACGVPDAGVGGAGGSIGPGDFDVVSLKSDFGFSLQDSWFISGCSQVAGHDCVNIPVCPNQTADFEDKGAVTNETFPLGGRVGASYDVTFRFNGIVEGKYYQGGQWAVPDSDIAMPGGQPPIVDAIGISNDTFYIGGNAVPSNYAVMRMRVLDPNKKEVGRYYMNAYPPQSGAESHRVFLVSYIHTIVVPGGGFVEYHLADSNCHMINNCDPPISSEPTCYGPFRNIPNEPNVILPAMYTDVASPTQPHLVPLGLLNPVTGAKQPWHSQISHLTVTKVVAK